MVIKRHMVKLGDVCRVLSGTTPDTNNPIYWKGNLPWITPAEITEDSDIIFDTKRAISKEAVEKKGLPLLPKGTVLLSSRAPIGKVAIAGIDMYCNQGFKNLVCSDKIYNKYLYFFLKSNTKFLNSLGRGATFKEISKSIVENILIPCPNIQIQKQIAERLDKVQELIAKQKEQIAKLDLLIKSRFLDMFGDPISNPKKWPTRRMGDIFNITSGGTPSTQEDSYWLNGTISWIGSNLCQNIILNKNDGRFITEKGLNNSSAKILPVGTVLIALVGATIGKTALLNFSTTTNQNVAAIWVSKEESYDSLFVFYFIQGLYDLFMRLGSGKFKMANLQFINNLPIFNVPLVLQTQFANFVKSVEQQKEVFSTRLSHLEVLYKSLMQEYFG